AGRCSTAGGSRGARGCSRNLECANEGRMMARVAAPRAYWYVLACIAMVAPGILWASLDRRPWPWDQAQYGEHTLRTLEAFRDGPLAGLAAMGVLMGIKAPGLTWLGMPF